jgi:hypothetical protein
MPSIFPDNASGGLIVFDHTSGLPVAQPTVENADVPDTFDSTCDMTALPSNCNARVSPAQINAIVSELVNLFVAMAPGREWDCTQLDNLAEAFEQFVANLAGGGGGSLICEAPMDEAGTIAEAALIFCDGTDVRRWTVHGENGLIEFILDQICGANNANIGNDDMIL